MVLLLQPQTLTPAYTCAPLPSANLIVSRGCIAVDVQPVDPLELWTTPPFEPTLQRKGKGQGFFSGRGVSDDKGGLLQPIQVLIAGQM